MKISHAMGPAAVLATTILVTASLSGCSGPSGSNQRAASVSSQPLLETGRRLLRQWRASDRSAVEPTLLRSGRQRWKPLHRRLGHEYNTQGGGGHGNHLALCRQRRSGIRGRWRPGCLCVDVCPSGMCARLERQLYVAETGNNVIRKIVASTGIITTVPALVLARAAREGGFGGDGGPAAKGGAFLSERRGHRRFRGSFYFGLE